MAKIGSFDVVQQTVAAAQSEAVEPDTFDFAGETDIRLITGPAAGLPVMEYANALYATDEADEGKALAASYDMLKYCIDPDDWTRFRAAAIRSGAGFQDLIALSQAVWGAVYGGPTSGPSVSPDGPSNTGASSRASSPAPTAPPSSTAAGNADLSRSVPVLVDAVWTPPPTMPGAGHLVAIDDWVAGRAA